MQARHAFYRARGRAAKAPKLAATGDELRAMVAQLDRSTLAGARDAAALLVGWWAALRRSELVALEIDDVTPSPGGIAIRIRWSKTDQEGQGATLGLEAKEGPLCPIAALEAWIEMSGIKSGPIFRGLTRHGGVRKGAMNDQEVARLVKRLAQGAGLDPKRFAGHSLRAGFITEAYRQGVQEAQIMATSRHRSVAMLARYRREADPVKRGATSKMKL
jgi:integrase